MFAGEPAHEDSVPAPPAQPGAPYQPAGQAAGTGGTGEQTKKQAKNSGGLFFSFFFSDKDLKLVGGGSVINGAYPL